MSSGASTAQPPRPDIDGADLVTCPRCGTPARATLNRREAQDFCAKCDFPLFWTPGAIIREDVATTGDSLRRLPGQAGRVAVASVPCPTCAEPNSLTATVCLRCGGPLVLPLPTPVAPPPVAVVAPPPAAPARAPWWPWAVGAGVVILATLVVLVVSLGT